jgi:hypothetical protein
VYVRVFVSVFVYVFVFVFVYAFPVVYVVVVVYVYVFVFVFIIRVRLRFRFRLRVRLRFRRCFRFRRRFHSHFRFRIRVRVCSQSFCFPNSFSFGHPISSRESGSRSACLLNSSLGKWLGMSHLPSDRRPRNLGKWAGTPLARQCCPGDQMPFPRQSRPEAHGFQISKKLFMRRSTIQFVGVPPLG